MDEVGSSIFHLILPAVLGLTEIRSPLFGAKKITFSHCEDTTKNQTNKLFVYFIYILCISSRFYPFLGPETGSGNPLIFMRCKKDAPVN